MSGAKYCKIGILLYHVIVISYICYCIISGGNWCSKSIKHYKLCCYNDFSACTVYTATLF